MVAIGTCQAGVTQGTTYMVLIMGTTQTKEKYSELLKPNKLIYIKVWPKLTPIHVLSQIVDFASLHNLNPSFLYSFTTVLVEMINALIRKQMLNFQSESVLSMEKMGRCIIVHLYVIVLCPLQLLVCDHWAYVLNELLTCLLGSIHQLGLY